MQEDSCSKRINCGRSELYRRAGGSTLGCHMNLATDLCNSQHQSLNRWLSSAAILLQQDPLILASRLHPYYPSDAVLFVVISRL
jgi:hypothetical protein